MSCHKVITIVKLLFATGQMADLATSVGCHWLLGRASTLAALRKCNNAWMKLS
jgi:hypothetical protein